MTFPSRLWPRVFAVMAIAFLIFQPPAHAYKPRVLRIGFIPSENAEDVARKARGLTALLQHELHAAVTPFVAGDYSGVIEAMKTKHLDMAYFSPGAYVLAERNAHAKAILKVLRGGKSTFYCAIITRRDSGLLSLRDLKGKVFAFGDPASLSGSLYPQLMLQQEGINPKRDFRQTFCAGGHDAIVLAVLNRKADAGATFANDNQGHSGAWVQFAPKRRNEIRVLAFSKALPSDVIAVSGDLDPALVAQIKGALVRLAATREGRDQFRRMYHVDGFAPAEPGDYAPVREVFDRIDPNH